MLILRRRACPFAVVLAVAAVAALPACRVPKSVYGPTGDNVAAAPGGEPAAIYDVSVGKSKGGQIQVWSEGVVTASGRTDTTEVAHSQPREFRVGFLLRNDSQSQLTLDPSDVRLRFEDIPDLRPRERTLVSVPPRQSSEVLLEFPLPGRFAAHPPDAYEVAWAVHFGPTVYGQTTSFTRELKRGIVPRRLDSSSNPPDQPYIQGSPVPPPIGIPFGADPNH